MNQWILAAALVTFAATSAQAAPTKSHHRKHHHTPAVAYFDNVPVDGKNYKGGGQTMQVCHGAIRDDCVEPYHPEKDQHP